jgi:hypothetical protein
MCKSGHKRGKDRLDYENDEDEDNGDDEDDGDDEDGSDRIHLDNRLLGQLVTVLQSISKSSGTSNPRRRRQRRSRTDEDLQKEKDSDQPDDRKDFLVGLTYGVEFLD